MRLRLGSFWLLFTGFLACGCGGDDNPPVAEPTPKGYCGYLTASLIAAAGDPEVPIEPITEESIPDSTCDAVERSYPIATPNHVTPCSEVSYGTNPPSSGTHYSAFPKFGVYRHAVPRGFLVHALEHGGVIFSYSCTDCAAEVAQAAELVRSMEIDPLCCSAETCGTATNRLILTPDPGLSTRWAASGWGFTMTADCFEPSQFERFAELYRGQGPEQICGNEYGTDVSRPMPD